MKQRYLLNEGEVATIGAALQHWQRCPEAQERAARPVRIDISHPDCRALDPGEINQALNYLMSWYRNIKYRENAGIEGQA